MTDKTAPYSPSNEAQVNAQRKDADKIREREIADIKNLLNQAWGRRIVWRLLGRAGIFELSYSFDGPRDAIHFKEGRRDGGLFLINEVMEADPEAYVKMMLENKPS